MGKKQRRHGSLVLVRQPVEEKENFKLKRVVFLLKIDPVAGFE